jgi:flagellar biosynthesis/type III secretory pathway protein FliH
MSAEKRLAYTMVLSANAAAVYQEQEKVAAAKAEGIAEGEAKGKAEGIAEGEARGIAEGEARAKAAAEAEKYAIKKEAIRRLQQRNFTDEDIADTMQETVAFVRAVKAEIMKEAADSGL